MLVAVAETTGPGKPGPAAPTTVIPSAGVPMVTVEGVAPVEVQLVYWPVIVTVRPVWAGLPILGLICVMTGVPAVTSNALESVIGLPLLVTVRSRFPTEALEATVMLAVNCVAVTLVSG